MPFNSGQRAEHQACRFLQQQGLSLVDRNVRCRFGEIDLIMRHGDTLVFVEVRYRRSASHGGAVASVTQTKQQKIIRTASWYLQQQRLDVPCRFDVVALDGETCQWLPAAFEAI